MGITILDHLHRKLMGAIARIFTSWEPVCGSCQCTLSTRQSPVACEARITTERSEHID
jgi:hypothetical protein